MTLEQPGFRRVCAELRRVRAPGGSRRRHSRRCCARCCARTRACMSVDVPIDYSDNERVLNREIKRLAAQLLKVRAAERRSRRSNHRKENPSCCRKTYPYYLANQPVAANTDLEVTDKFSGEVATRVAIADAAAIDAAIGHAVSAQAPRCARFAPFKRAGGARTLREALSRALTTNSRWRCASRRASRSTIRRARSRASSTRSGSRPRKSVRIDGEHRSISQISPRANGYHGYYKRVPIGPCSFISPFNFPLEPDRAQGRAGDRGRRAVRAEADEPHARSARSITGRDSRGDRPAEGRVLDPSRASRRRRSLHHRRTLSRCCRSPARRPWAGSSRKRPARRR